MKRLYRDRWDKKLAGVCGGIGQFLEVDPTVIRLLAIFLCVITAFLPFVVLYIIAWMLMPLGFPTYVQYDCHRLYRSVRDRKIAGICGGISEALKIDPIIVRLVTIIALIPTGFFPVIITYIIGIAIIPERPEGQV
ncbi:MAG: PspC domain-containing protein [Candidatus Neptunochlamydia sp.]|nr:PspC domain-containing protein [Candidatus Neptunochlamydia sp.]